MATRLRPAWRISERVDADWRSMLVNEYLGGATVDDLVRRHDLGRASVRRLLKEAGVPMKRAALSKEQRLQAVALYESGLSIREVALTLGRSKTTVQDCLTRSGVKMRPAMRVPRRG